MRNNANKSFIEVTKRIKIPCGEYCDGCEYIASKEIVKRNPWNDEIEDIQTITYCNLYGDTLIVEKDNSCPYHCFFKYKKCLKCKDNFMKKEEKDLTALLMLCLNNRNKGEQQ